MIETISIVGISIAALGFAALAVGLSIRISSLETKANKLQMQRDLSLSERAETRDEFNKFRSSEKKKQERLMDEISDLQDLLGTCTDPDIVHGHFDRMLEKATGSDSDSNSD